MEQQKNIAPASDASRQKQKIENLEANIAALEGEPLTAVEEIERGVDPAQAEKDAENIKGEREIYESPDKAVKIEYNPDGPIDPSKANRQIVSAIIIAALVIAVLVLLFVVKW